MSTTYAVAGSLVAICVCIALVTACIDGGANRAAFVLLMVITALVGCCAWELS